jgi:Family of unknown function (DUF5329)
VQQSNEVVTAIGSEGEVLNGAHDDPAVTRPSASATRVPVMASELLLSQTRSSNNATGRAVAMHIKETDMRFKFLASLALLFSMATMWPASLVGTAAALEDTEKTISYLLDYVARTDATFIRNGREATGKQAADHLRQKWDYFRKTIKTPEDFIQLAATKSELSGKLYLVRFKDGKESPAGEWLAKVLAEYRKRSSP